MSSFTKQWNDEPSGVMAARQAALAALRKKYNNDGNYSNGISEKRQQQHSYLPRPSLRPRPKRRAPPCPPTPTQRDGTGSIPEVTDGIAVDDAHVNLSDIYSNIKIPQQRKLPIFHNNSSSMQPNRYEVEAKVREREVDLQRRLIIERERKNSNVHNNTNVEKLQRRRRVTVKDKFFQSFNTNTARVGVSASSPSQQQRQQPKHINKNLTRLSRAQRQHPSEQRNNWMSNYDWVPVKERKYVGDSESNITNARYSKGKNNRTLINNNKRRNHINRQNNKHAKPPPVNRKNTTGHPNAKRGEANIEKYKKIIMEKDAASKKSQDIKKKKKNQKNCSPVEQNDDGDNNNAKKQILLERKKKKQKKNSKMGGGERRKDVSLYEQVLLENSGGDDNTNGNHEIDDSSSSSDESGSSTSRNSSGSSSSSSSSSNDSDSESNSSNDSGSDEEGEVGDDTKPQQVPLNLPSKNKNKNKNWKRQIPPGSPSDIAILRRCDTLAEYVQYLENKYGVDMTENHWKQINKVDHQNKTGGRGIDIGEAAPLTPTKEVFAPEIASLEYTGGDADEQKRIRAMIKARVAADVEAEKRRRREDELEQLEEIEKATKREYVDEAIEGERVRRMNDRAGESAKQRGARRLSLNFINDLIQKDPTFITKTWGY
jgi:hypothetical protein